MEKERNDKGIIALLIVIIIILSTLCALLATGTISFDNIIDEQKNNSGNIEQNESELEKDNKITQSKLEKIMEEELYIVTNMETGRNTIKSLSDINNNDLLTLAFDLFEKISNNKTVSTAQIEKILDGTCLANLPVSFETFDVYELNNNTYTKDENVMSKRSFYNARIAAHKTVAFTEKNNQYTLSVKNIFTDLFAPQYGYGSIDNLKNSKNPAVALYNSETNVNIDNVQKYMNENFEKIKDKLATYNYVFENQDGKVVLVDFYIN